MGKLHSGEYLSFELKLQSAEFKSFHCRLRPLFVQEAYALMSAKASGISARIQLTETRWWRRIQVAQLHVDMDCLELTPHTEEMPWYLQSFLRSCPETRKHHVCRHLESRLREQLE